jgi:protein TonB
LSLKKPGENLYNARILGLKEPSKTIKRGVHTLAKRKKNSTKEKNVMGKTPVHPLPKERRKSKVQKVKPSPTPSPSTHQGEKVLAHESRPLTTGPPTERKVIPVAWEPKGSGFQTNGGKGDEGTGGLIPPVPTQREKPPYPPLARKRGYQGRLILRLSVSREGKVARVKVIRSSGYSILDRTAVKTVKEWRFIPAHRGKEVMPFWVEVPVVFSLKGAG